MTQFDVLTEATEGLGVAKFKTGVELNEGLRMHREKYDRLDFR